MALLGHYVSILGEETVTKLQRNKIRSIMDLLCENADTISKITGLTFKEVLALTDNLVNNFRTPPVDASYLCTRIREKSKVLSTGISKLESRRIYELCGPVGCGKTQICFGLACSVALQGEFVMYIDCKNDFSELRIVQILCERCSDQKVLKECLEKIKVISVSNMEELIDALHEIKLTFSATHIPLIIIDSISAIFFQTFSPDSNKCFALLNHIASLMKFITSTHHSSMIVTNLATKVFGNLNNANDESSMEHSEKSKPCMGAYWQQVSNVRLDVEKTSNSECTVTINRDDRNLAQKSCKIDLGSMLS